METSPGFPTQETQSQEIRRQIKLPMSISEVNPDMGRLLKKDIVSCIVGLPGKLHTVDSKTNTTIQLPNLQGLSPDFQMLLKEQLFDKEMNEHLHRIKVLNWCRNIRPFFPLRTMGDGNCLLHAVSMAMWGMADTTMLLRRLVYIALVEDEEQGHIKKRWHREKGRLNEAVSGFYLNLDSREWEQEWDMVVKAAEDRRLDNANNQPNYGDLLYECLEEIHIFVLSNVLKRPIIVLGESVIRGMTGASLAPNNFRGVYLPLLWRPDECVKTPVVLAFHNNHFAPLVSFRDNNQLEDACPLVTSDLECFRLHFLLQHEESVIHRILESYLDVTEVSSTRPDGVAMILSAKMDYVAMPENRDLVKNYMHYAEKQYRDYERLKRVGKFSDTTLAKSSADKEVNALSPNVDNVHLSIPQSTNPDEEVTTSSTFAKKITPSERGGLDKQSDTLIPGNLTQGNQGALPRVIAKPAAKSCQLCGRGQANPKYGGQCSQCYASMQMEENPHDVNPSSTQGGELDVEPTAPDQSLVTNATPTPSLVNTFSWRQQGSLTNTLVGPQKPPAPLVEGMSMMSQHCLYHGCQNLCSINTYPFCHEHKSDSSQRRGHFNKQKSSSTSDDPSQPLALLVEEPGESRSLEDSIIHERGRATPCRESGCKLYGLPEWDFKCSQHKHSPQSPQGAGLHSWQRCRKSGCSLSGNARYKGMCSGCFASEDPEPSSQQKREVTSPKHASPRKLGPSSFERRLNDTRKCIGPTCENMGFETYNGLCETCYTLILQQRMSIGAQSASSRSPTHESTSRGFQPCHTAGCRMYGAPEHRGLCSVCWKKQQLANKVGVQMGSGNTRHVAPQTQPLNVEYKVSTGIPIPEANRCRTGHCDRFGDPSFGGFCSLCYVSRTSLPSSAPRRTSPPPALSRSSSSHESTHGRPPVPISGELLGQTTSYSAPITPSLTGEESSTTEAQYSVAMKRLEKTIRSSVRQCKIQGCRNFGNPKCQGYCNDCYRNLGSNSLPARHTHGTAIPRNGGWDECDNPPPL